MAKGDKNMSSVQIVYPESKVLYNMPKTILVSEILKKACAKVDSFEIWWFGFLATSNKGFDIWLASDKKLNSHDIKLDSNGSIVLRFLVKFYPIDYKSEVVQEATKKLFYQHLRQQIMTEALYCDPANAVSLGSLHLQYKLGDLSRTSACKEIVKENFSKIIPEGVIKRHQMSEKDWLTIISDMWNTNSMLVPQEAMVEALKIMQDLDMHGVRYYQIKNSRGTKLFLGVESSGMNIYKSDNMMIPKVGLVWSEIKSISYSDKKFVIKPIERNAPDFIMFSDDLKENQIIMHICIGNHQLYMSRRSREDPEDIRILKEKALAKKAEEDAIRQKAVEEQEKKVEYEQKAAAQMVAIASANKEEDKERVRQEVEREYKKALEDMQKKLSELEGHASQLASQKKDKDDEVSLVKGEVAEKEQALEQTKKELELFKKKYEEDQRKIQELEKLKAEGKKVEVKEPPKTDYKTLRKNREKETSTQINKVDNILKEKNTGKTNLDQNREEIVKSGNDKYKTLRSIRTGNTRARIDEFEAF